MVKNIVILLFLANISIMSCRETGDSLVTEEGCTNCDTLYLGYRFGMTLDDFYDHCRKLNREGTLFEGDQTNTVTQEIDLTVAARIYIHPDFDEQEKIYRLKMHFQYNVLPMFRQDLTPLKLRGETLAFMEEATGKKFRRKDHPVYKQVWENVEGYRRIRLYHEGERVVVEYYDLRHQVTG